MPAGGGLVGLAVARAVGETFGGASLLTFGRRTVSPESEQPPHRWRPLRLSYQPESLKARLCVEERSRL